MAWQPQYFAVPNQTKLATPILTGYCLFLYQAAGIYMMKAFVTIVSLLLILYHLSIAAPSNPGVRSVDDGLVVTAKDNAAAIEDQSTSRSIPQMSNDDPTFCCTVCLTYCDCCYAENN